MKSNKENTKQVRLIDLVLVIFLVNSNRLLQGLRFGSFSNEPLSLPYKPIIPHIQTNVK